MDYNYTPIYYSSIQDSITSICKSILEPFSVKKRGLLAEQKIGKQQSDNLKWQQKSFHQILNLMGLEKEGIVSHSQVSAFRSQLLDTLIASRPGPAHEPPPILRDKLIFLQELLYAKCISTEEYHASKRPLLQRLAVQGAEIEARDVIVGTLKGGESSEEEWSIIDLRDEQCLLSKENSTPRNQSKHVSSAMKHIKEAASVLGRGLSHRQGKNREQRTIFDLPTSTISNYNDITPNARNISMEEKRRVGENPFWNNNQNKESEMETKSILMSEGLTPNSDNFGSKKGSKETMQGLSVKKVSVGNGEEMESKSAIKWGFDGFKRWKKRNKEQEEESQTLKPRKSCHPLVVIPVGQGPDTKQMKKKLLSDASDSSFFIDKVLGNNIKKELSRIQTQLSATNPNFQLSNDQMDAISTKLPVDKADLKQFFPKSWCDRYGDVVLNVVKKEFQDHVGEMENSRIATLERRHTNSKRWTTFDEDENLHPNQCASAPNHTSPMSQNPFASSINTTGW